MDGETMIRSRASDRHDPEDHLDPLARKIVGFDRAQIRVPVDLPERLPEIVGALQTLVAHLSAISQAALPARSKALSIRAAVQECEFRMRRIGKGRIVRNPDGIDR